MKNKLAVLSASVVLASFAQVATANEGKINFEGGVSDTTCTVVVNKQTNDATVKLPIVSSKLLKVEGSTAGRTFLNFQLSDCSSASTLASKAKVFFSAGGNITPEGHLRNTAQTNATKNVELQILNKDGKVMDLSLGTGAQGAIGEDLVADANGIGTAYLSHFVQYISQGDATAGGLTSSVDYEIDYE